MSERDGSASGAKMNNQTLCWQCSGEYTSTETKCPACQATNANLDLLAAIEQAGGYCHGLFPPHDWESAADSADQRESEA